MIRKKVKHIYFKSFIDNADIDVYKRQIYGEVSEKYGGYKWQKLQNCADYFGYKFKTHDSYEDAKATLYCYHKIMERKEV